MIGAITDQAASRSSAAAERTLNIPLIVTQSLCANHPTGHQSLYDERRNVTAFFSESNPCAFSPPLLVRLSSPLLPSASNSLPLRPWAGTAGTTSPNTLPTPTFALQPTRLSAPAC